MNYREVSLFARRLRNNQTPCEKQLWKQIRGRQLEGFKFLRQHPIIYDRNGNALNVFIPDFYCPSLRLVIELDGGVHLNNQENDFWRDQTLAAMDITVLRIQNDDLVYMEEVLQKIRRILLELRAARYAYPRPLPARRDKST